MSGILLDTCALLWLINGQSMKEAAIKSIEEARNAHLLYISPISAWEIAHLCHKKKITLTMSANDWFSAVMAADGVKSADLIPKILIDSVELGGDLHPDPADRIMISTARTMNLTLVSRDGLIKKYASQGYVKFMEC